VIFLAGLTIPKKETCQGFFIGCGGHHVSGHFEWMWGDPVVALRLRNAADYRLPTFWPHGTKLGNA